jgi:hypothetical protein
LASQRFAGKDKKNMKILKEESGQTVVVAAAFMGLLALGFMAFALDVGTLFREKRMAQAAADAAALAAAEESANASSNEQTVANAMATLNGFNTSAATNPATVTLSSVSPSGFTGSTYIQATVSMPVKTFFLGAFRSADSTMSVAASAIAGGGNVSQTCVCLEGTSGEVLNMSNDATLNASGCGVVDNSTSSNAISVVGSSTITALSVGAAASSWFNSTNIQPTTAITSSHILQGLTSTCAPTMPTAPTWSSCNADPGGSSGTFTFGPASATSVICYTGLTIGANGSTCTLNPGIYVINNGELHFDGGTNLGGNGVFFYLTGTASLVIDNGASAVLVAGGATESGGATAPSVSNNGVSYNGIVIYQAASDTAGMSLQGGSSTYINGAVYTPGATLTVGNGSGSTFDGGIVASSLVMDGGGVLHAVTDMPEGSVNLGGVMTLVQ